MKKNITKKVSMSLVLLVAVMLSGCGQSDEPVRQSTDNAANVSQESPVEKADEKTDDTEKSAGSELEVHFGDDGDSFMLQLNDSDTAAAIARHVGTSDWRLPIYEDDKDADYDVMQYYDIPSNYEIPSAPEKVTSVKAGEVYYSEPNRIVLYYQDAEIEEEEYTPVGQFDATDEFVEAVKNNPVLEGWGNKIVLITKP